ncbi:ABC transporter permease, partial [bacterium M00.F.Ca.ET.168.01.1.1]
AEQRGTLLAFGIFMVMFAIYSGNHPAGFTANVVQTAANKGVLLAFVAMAQTLVVITAGIDLSVGAVLGLSAVVTATMMISGGFGLIPTILAVLVMGIVFGVVQG